MLLKNDTADIQLIPGPSLLCKEGRFPLLCTVERGDEWSDVGVKQNVCGNFITNTCTLYSCCAYLANFSSAVETKFLSPSPGEIFLDLI